MFNKLEGHTFNVEVTNVERVLIATRGNMSDVARMLGGNRGTIRRILEEKRSNVVLIHRNEQTSEIEKVEFFF